MVCYPETRFVLDRLQNWGGGALGLPTQTVSTLNFGQRATVAELPRFIRVRNGQTPSQGSATGANQSTVQIVICRNCQELNNYKEFLCPQYSASFLHCYSCILFRHALKNWPPNAFVTLIRKLLNLL